MTNFVLAQDPSFQTVRGGILASLLKLDSYIQFFFSFVKNVLIHSSFNVAEKKNANCMRSDKT